MPPPLIQKFHFSRNGGKCTGEENESASCRYSACEDLETELFDTTIMPDVSQSTTEKAKTGKFFKQNHLHG